MMNNKATLESVGTFVCQKAFEDEQEMRLKAEASEARVVVRNREAIRIIEAALPTAGYPVKGKMKRALRVLRGDRR